jgi:hypothetical protein
MSPQQQVSQQMNNEFEKFRDTVYDGVIKVPENIIELFKKGVVHLSPHAHQINFTKIKHLVHQTPSKLSNGELTDVIKVILNTPFDVLYGKLELDKGIDEHIRFEKFIVCYNTHIDAFQQKMKMKQATLNSIANANGNGLKLVN